MRASDEKPLNQGATHLIKAKSDQPMPTAEWMAKFEKSPKLFLDAVKLWMNGAKLHREFVESINEVELRRKLPAGFESLTESIALFMEVNPRFDLKPLIEFSQFCVSIRDCHDSRDSWAQSELSEIADGQLSLSVGSDSKLIAHVQALFGRCEYHCNRLIRFASIQNELLSRENFEHQSAWNSEKPVAVWSAPYPMDAVSDKPIPTAQWMENFESQSQLLVDAIGEWQDGARYWHNYVADRTYGRESKGTPPVGFGPLTDALVMWSQTPGHGQISLKPLKEFMRLCCGAREIDARGGELRHVGIHLTDAELFERVCALSIECHHTCFDFNRQALLQCERAAKGNDKGESAALVAKGEAEQPEWVAALLEDTNQDEGAGYSINSRMMVEIVEGEGDESILDRTQREWGQKLGCSKTAIGRQPAWGAILKLREARKDRSIKQRASS